MGGGTMAGIEERLDLLATLGAFWRELKYALRSLAGAKGLSITVVLTLALGIGANAAIFTLVRGVLLKPLVNRDEARLIYIRQSAPGMGDDNTTFSVPEIRDLQASVKSVSAFGDFSVMAFTMIGLGEPRSIRGGVVGGTYFDVMGLHPVLGRLIGPQDDGPKAEGVVVLTYRFWANTLHKDPTVLGKTVRLGSIGDRSATIIGVLEPCVPFPQDTEIISNIVTSSHHLSATMVTGRIHRMTDLFARLAPGSDLEAARAELDSVYRNMQHEHPDAYPARSDLHISAVRLRDELTSGARTILLVLMAASLLVFVIACSNVANLVLARTIRRENELGVRAALGATAFDLRRILLSESLLLSLAGAGLGLFIAGPLLDVLARYASRYSIRALAITLDPSMLWVGAGLAVLAAALLAFVPRLPSSGSSHGLSLAPGGQRATGATNRRLKIFALVQIAASFVLIAASAATVNTLLSLQRAKSAFDTHHVLAFNVPVIRDGKTQGQVVEQYREAARRIAELPGVVNVAVSNGVPWRDPGLGTLEFALDGHVPVPGEEHPRANFQVVTPAFFATLG